MEANQVDPYAPPKTALTGTDNTTYLNQDGYASNNDLVANWHFKPPLICAKLGIRIPAESYPNPKKITITRELSISKFIFSMISAVCFLLFIIGLYFIGSNYFMPALIGYLLTINILKHLYSIPYQISFYFSEQHAVLRKRRILFFRVIFLVITTIAIYTIKEKMHLCLYFCFFAAVIIFFIYKFKTSYFSTT